MSRRGSLTTRVAPIAIGLLVAALMLAPTGAATATVPPAAASAHADASGSASAGGASPFPLQPFPSARRPSVLPSGSPSHPSGSLSSVLPYSSDPATWPSLADGHTVAAPAGFVPLVSPPNLNLAHESTTDPGSTVSPGYQAPPAPMGLSDLGVGASGAYSYNTSGFLATVTFASPPNATAAGSDGVIDPAASENGLVGSPYEFSLQLNTIGTNVTMPGVSNGSIWAQNVLDINDSAIHFVDDVWNLTANSSFAFSFGAIVSGCNGADVDTILGFEDGVYQCVGATIAISPASYPLTIQLYNNVSVVGMADEVQFGYRIVADGAPLAAGVSDTVVFANPTGAPPTAPIAFEVNGSSPAPVQPAGYPRLLQDAEIVFGGPIGGTNAVFHALDASLGLDRETSTGGWISIPSAYDFGSDTGETAIGVTAYWRTAGTEQIDQGPSFLYGLWGAPSALSAPAGSLTFAGTVDPSYGFVFVSNVNPGPNGTNLSYVPTQPDGAFSSILPPSIGATGPYVAELYAAGFSPEAGPTFSTDQPAYAFPAPTANATISAPLYAVGDAQAASLASNVTGAPVGDSGPFVFSNLTVNLPYAFTHLNDFLYPSFVVVQAQELTAPLVVNNTTQGSNAPGGTIYTLDSSAGGGWMSSNLTTVGPWANYSLEIDAWASAGPSVTNETFLGPFNFLLNGTRPPGQVGGVAFFFDDTNAGASAIVSEDGSTGVANVRSTGTRVTDVGAESGANALTDVGSAGTSATSVAADGCLYYAPAGTCYSSVGVYVLDGTGETVDWLNASDDAIGYVSGSAAPEPTQYALVGSTDARVANLNATFGAIAALDSYSHDDAFVDVGVWDASGVATGWSTGTTVENVLGSVDQSSGALLSGFGVLAYDATDTVVANATFNLDLFCASCAGVALYGSNDTLVTGVTIVEAYELFGGYEFFNSFSPDGIVSYGGSALTIVGATVVEEIAYGYGPENGLNDANLTGILVLGTPDTVVVETQVNETYAIVAEGEEFNDISSFTGVLLEGSNDSLVADTAIGMAFSASFLNTAEYLGTYFDGVGVVGANASRIAATTASESANFSYLYEAEGNDLGFAAAVLESTTNGSILSTTVSERFAAYHLSYTDGNSGQYYAAVAFGTEGSTIEGTDVEQNFSVSEAFQQAGNDQVQFYGVYVGFSLATTVEGTTGAQAFGLVDLPGTAYNETAYFALVYGELTESLAVDGTGVAQNFSLESVDYVYQDTATFDAVAAFGSTNVTAAGITVTQSYFADVGFEALFATAYFDGGDFGQVSGLSVAGVSATESYNVSGFVSVYEENFGRFYGVYADPVTNASLTGVSVRGVSNAYDGVFTGAEFGSSSNLSVTGVTAATTLPTVEAGSGLVGVSLVDVTNATVRFVMALGGAQGIEADPSSDLTIASVTASEYSVGVELEAVDSARLSGITASSGSVGVEAFESTDLAIADVSVANQSAGVVLLAVDDSSVSAVRATNTTASSPWEAAFRAYWGGIPVAAVVTALTDDVTIRGVSATNYSADLIDFDSGRGFVGPGGLGVADLSATGGYALVVLNGTDSSQFSALSGTGLADGIVLNATYGNDFATVAVTDDGLGIWAPVDADDSFTALNASNDSVGVVLGSLDGPTTSADRVWSSTFANDSEFGIELLNTANSTFWLNAFTDNGGYGIYLWASQNNTVWDNSFVGNNGATTVYDPAHPQAYSASADNRFNSTAQVGNYWADWHTYTAEGVLAPYFVGGGAWDYYPLGIPASAYPVVFEATGLGSGAVWSVTFDGSTQATSNRSILFGSAPGSFAFVVTAPAGYVAAPASGTVTVPIAGGAPVSIVFTAVYAVTVSETGLTTGTTWSATVGGITGTSSGTAVTVLLPSGTYAFQVPSVPGFTASPSTGNVSVAAAPYDLSVAFTAVLYSAYFAASGLPSGTTWTVVVNGISASSSTGAITVPIAAGTYDYRVVAVAGYTASPISGTVSVSATPSTIAVAFSPVPYAITVSETGLPTGTGWAVTVGGAHLSGSGTTLTGSLTAGTYAFLVVAVPGYTAAPANGSVTVTSSGGTIVVTFTPTGAGPSYVRSSALTTDFGLALGLAAVGVVLGLVALLRRPKASPPPSQWNAGSGGGATEAAGAPAYLEGPADGAAKGQAQE